MERRFLCDLCRISLKGIRRPSLPTPQGKLVHDSIRTSLTARSHATKTVSKKRANKPPVLANKQRVAAIPRKKESLNAAVPQPPAPVSEEEFESPTNEQETTNTRALMEDVGKEQEALIHAQEVPEEIAAIHCLERCRGLAEILVFGKTDALKEESSEQGEKDSTSTSSLLNELEEDASSGVKKLEVKPAAQLSPRMRKEAADTLAKLSTNLLRHPNIFITSPMLHSYVRTMCLLGSPEHLPEIFHLYANKPIPIVGTSPPQYRAAKPKSAQQAIPRALAEAALTAAIQKQHMLTAIDILDTTYCSPAWKRYRVIRQAGPPGLAVGALPLIAWTIATEFAHWQKTMDESTAVGTVLAGIGGYLFILGTTGYVALTTNNWHHRRVSWHVGTRMWERWLREDERAALDRIAQGWGYKDRLHWGEETGEDWDALRELVGMRGMILDRSTHLEGLND